MFCLIPHLTPAPQQDLSQTPNPRQRKPSSRNPPFTENMTSIPIANLAFLPAELQDNIVQRCEPEDLSSIRMTCASLERATCDLFGAAFFETRVCNLGRQNCRDLVAICCNHTFGKFVRTILVETSCPSSHAMGDVDNNFATESLTWIFRTLKGRGQGPLTIGTCSRYKNYVHTREVGSIGVILEAALRSRIAVHGLCLKIGSHHRDVYNMATAFIEHEKKTGFTRMIRGLKHLELRSDTGFLDEDYEGLWKMLVRATELESLRLVSTTNTTHSSRRGLLYQNRHSGVVMAFPSLRRFSLSMHMVPLENVLEFLNTNTQIEELELQYISFQVKNGARRVNLFDRISEYMVNLQRFNFGTLDEMRARDWPSKGHRLLYRHVSEPVVLVGRQEIDEGLLELGDRLEYNLCRTRAHLREELVHERWWAMLRHMGWWRAQEDGFLDSLFAEPCETETAMSWEASCSFWDLDTPASKGVGRFALDRVRQGAL